MPSNSETGHAKNVANFEHLIAFCNGYGTAYDPFNTNLSVSGLSDLRSGAIDAMDLLRDKKTKFDQATNQRKIGFEELKALSTRITNAFAVSGTSNEALKDLQLANKKIHGRRATKLPGLPEDPNAPQPVIVSASQQSYDNLLEHFAKMIDMILQEPLYKPNEADLKIPALQTRKAILQTKNTNIAASYTEYSNARIARNKTLYNKQTGLVETANAVKLYVKSLFGARSPQYRQVSRLSFRLPKQ